MGGSTVLERYPHLTSGELVCRDLEGILAYTLPALTDQLPVLNFWKEICPLGYVLDPS